MREIPILFKGPMVRAILDGRKTMTRRLRGLERINARPDDWVQAVQLNDDTWSFWGPNRVDERWVRIRAYPQGGGFKCPYEVGDRLWVRETWVLGYRMEEQKKVPEVIYMADNPISYEPIQWRPSIHMPKWACRLWLTVKEVKVERLQEITEEDAWSEGVRSAYEDSCYPPCSMPDPSFRTGFARSWDAMYSKQPEYQWQANPWVWVILFSREDCPAKEKP